MIIVMPDGNTGTMGGFGERTLKVFEAEVKNCIIPFVEKNYRAETDAKNRALQVVNGWITNSLCWNK
jgi:hypothetical protein